MCNKDYQGFGKFRSLRNTLTNSRSTMSLSSCLLFYVDEQHLDIYTYKVVTQQRRQWLATFDIAIHNRYKDRRYLGYLLMFQFRIQSNSILMLVLWLFNWDNESVSPNRKLNLITWWICFSFKKVDRRNAIIHAFTKTPPTQGSRKVVRFMQNKPHFSLYKAQRTNVNIQICTHTEIEYPLSRHIIYIDMMYICIHKSITSLCMFSLLV